MPRNKYPPDRMEKVPRSITEMLLGNISGKLEANLSSSRVCTRNNTTIENNNNAINNSINEELSSSSSSSSSASSSVSSSSRKKVEDSGARKIITAEEIISEQRSSGGTAGQKENLNTTTTCISRLVLSSENTENNRMLIKEQETKPEASNQREREEEEEEDELSELIQLSEINTGNNNNNKRQKITSAIVHEEHNKVKEQQKRVESCVRCGFILPSVQTGRDVCTKTGWCHSCDRIPPHVSGNMVRESLNILDSQNKARSMEQEKKPTTNNRRGREEKEEQEEEFTESNKSISNTNKRQKITSVIVQEEQQEHKHDEVVLDIVNKATDTRTTTVLLPKLLRLMYTDEFDMTMNQVQDMELELDEQQVVMIKNVVKAAFSNMRIETMEKLSTSISSLTDKKIPVFIRKTYQMVNTCDPTICCWSEDGAHFVVKDVEKFVKEIIPQYFKALKIQSFERQLQFYSFHKLNTYADSLPNSTTVKFRRFSHPKFQRGRLHLLKEVKRKGESRFPEENINTSTDNNKVNENRISTSTMHTSSIDVDQKFEKALVCESNNSSNNDIKNKTISSRIVDIKPVLTDVEIPVFLRKIYHMFNTYDDPTVCSWSEDGTMIVVKNVSKFENDIIPQFFKHNKFTSFVRQLNFYGFRKLNNINNSIRIDAPTEKFWRFYHPKFQHNRTDLLKHMKRSAIKKKEKKTEQLTTTTTQSVGISNNNVAKGTTIDDDEIKCNGDHQLHNTITTTTTTTTVTPINIRPPASPPPPSHLLQSNDYSGDNNNEGDLLFGEYYDSDCNSTDSDLVF